mmetsp:Transcript_18064/g.68490  ORF Transcript_18064/g.68490 Transcript_18064/m.68490 type:complete len:210 (-) Transcript_18064:149-778(-)
MAVRLDASPHGVHGLSGLLDILEDGASCHYDVGASLGRCVNRVEAEAAVHLDVKIGKRVSQGLHFRHHVLHEALAPKAGLYGHYQHHVEQLYVRHQRFHRRAGLDDDATAHVQALDLIPKALDRRHLRLCTSVLRQLRQNGLQVEGEVVGPRVGEGLEPRLGVGDHQVAVQVRIRQALPQALHHGRAPSEIWDEMAVHDVQVKVVGAIG